MKDETLARQFQERYTQGERGALAGLYSELRFFAGQSAKKYYRNHHISVDPERIDEISHEAATKIIERYLKDESYSIRKFRRVSKDSVWSVVSRRYASDSKTDGEPSEPSGTLQANHHEQLRGFEKRVVIDVALAESYQKALVSIAEYVPMWWLISRAERLHKIYRMIRGKKEKRTGLYRSGDFRGGKKTVQGIQTQPQSCNPVASRKVDKGKTG